MKQKLVFQDDSPPFKWWMMISGSNAGFENPTLMQIFLYMCSLCDLWISKCADAASLQPLVVFSFHLLENNDSWKEQKKKKKNSMRLTAEPRRD